MNESDNKMDPKAKGIAVLFILIIIGIIIGVAVSSVALDSIDKNTKVNIILNKANIKNWGSLDRKDALILGRQLWDDFSEIYMLVTVVIMMNLSLLLGLFGIYANSFRKTKSSFMLGLVLFLGVLFAQALFSLPALQVLLGQSISDLGIFHIIPNLLETIALVILFYLSME